MLKQLRLKNFQGYENAVVNFSKGVNSFIGLTDSGKTAIAIRAVRWVVFDKPSGRKVMRKPLSKAPTSVLLRFSDGVAIERKITKSKNLYSIYRPGKKKQTFSGFGRSIPEEVKNSLNLFDLNFHLQGEFLLGQKSLARARYINDLVNLDEIDLTLSRINKECKAWSGKKKQIEDAIAEKESELEQYNWVSESEGFISEVKRAIMKHDQIKRKIRTLTEIKDDIEHYSNELKEIDFIQVDRDIRLVYELKDALDEIENLESKVEELSGLKTSLESLKEEKVKTETKEKNIDKKIRKLTPDICPFCGAKMRKK